MGKVYRFYGEWTIEKKLRTDVAEKINAHLEFVAHELMHTSIAVKEAGFPTAPSVLIITTSVQPSESYLRMLNRNLKVKTNYTDGVYADKRDPIDDVFLGEIVVDRNTGVHYHTSLPMGETPSARFIEKAQRFFDIVLIAPSMTSKIPGKVDHVFGLSLYDNDRANFTPLRVSSNVHSSYMRDPDEDKTIYLYAEESTDLAFVRATSLDIIRAMLNVKGAKTVYELMPRMNPVSHGTSKLANKILDSGIGYAASFAGALATVLGGAFLLSGAVADISMVTAAPVIAGAPTTAIMTAAGVDFVAGFSRREKAAVDSVVRNVEFYDRCEVADSPVAKSPIILLTADSSDGEQSSAAITNQSSSKVEVTASSPLSYGIVPLEDLRSRIETVKEDWIGYELEPMKALEYPLMLDATCEQTNAFLQAMREAEHCLKMAEKDPSVVGRLSLLVEKVEGRFLAAEAHAQKMRLSHLTAEQKKVVSKVRSLAAVFGDDSASPNEKKSAFEQANKSLEGIMKPLSPKIIGLLGA